MIRAVVKLHGGFSFSAHSSSYFWYPVTAMFLFMNAVMHLILMQNVVN